MTTPSELTAPDLTFSTGDAGELTILLTDSQSSDGFRPIWVALPGSGQLEVIYEFIGQPPATAILWHQGGNYDQLILGPNTYNSLPGDALYFSISDQTQSLKVGWAYV
jgi:hypothetical protein